MIELLCAKVFSNDELDMFPKTHYHIESYDFIAIESLTLAPKPILSERIIFSSQNAVRGFIHNFGAMALKGKRLYVVGDHTAASLEALGGKISARRNSAQELAHALEDPSERSYDWFCGTLSLDDIPKAFKRNGVVLNSYKVYRTQLTPHKLSSSYDGILFFSPSAVKAFFQNNTLSAQTKPFAIGKTTAKTLSAYTDQTAAFPKKPSIKNLLKLVKDHFDVEK